MILVYTTSTTEIKMKLKYTIEEAVNMAKNCGGSKEQILLVKNIYTAATFNYPWNVCGEEEQEDPQEQNLSYDIYMTKDKEGYPVSYKFYHHDCSWDYIDEGIFLIFENEFVLSRLSQKEELAMFSILKDLFGEQSGNQLISTELRGA